MIRKLFLILIAAASLAIIPTASAGPAAVCSQPNGYCEHWLDSNRPTHIQVERVGLTNPDFVSPINASLSAFQTAQGSPLLIFTPASTYRDFAPGGAPDTQCQGPGIVFRIEVCLGDFYNPCGSSAAHRWLGCTQPYVAVMNAGTGGQSPSPHMTTVDVQFAWPAHNSDGTVYTWGSIPNDRRFVACHEITGHGMGMNHSDSSTPDTTSCLNQNLTATPSTTLNATVVGQIKAIHNHNDHNSGTPDVNCQEWCLDAATHVVHRTYKRQLALARKAGGIPSFAKLLSGQRMPDGQVMYYVPKKFAYDWWNFPTENENPFVTFITEGTPDAITVDSPTTAWVKKVTQTPALSALGVS